MDTQLGLVRAIVILWVSGAVASVLVGMFVSPVGWSVLGGSNRFADAGVIVAVVALQALVGAVGVTIGVEFCGFRISYASAVVAVLVGGVLGMAFTVFFAEVQPHAPTTDPRAELIPALGALTWPLQLVVGTLLPAFLVNAAARPPASCSAPPEIPPYPPAGGYS